MDRDDTDEVLLDLAPPEEPDPDMIPGAEEVTGGVEEGPTEGEQNNQNWFGGLITMIILIGLAIAFCGIVQGNLALMVASAVVTIVIPVAFFVGVIGWRAGSAEKTKDNNTNKKGENK